MLHYLYHLLIFLGYVNNLESQVIDHIEFFFSSLGQTWSTLVVDMKNEAFVDAIVGDPDLIKARKNLGDHPNRIDPDILRKRKSFDDVPLYDKIEKPNGYHKNNPFTRPIARSISIRRQAKFS